MCQLGLTHQRLGLTQHRHWWRIHWLGQRRATEGHQGVKSGRKSRPVSPHAHEQTANSELATSVDVGLGPGRLSGSHGRLLYLRRTWEELGPAFLPEASGLLFHLVSIGV